MGFKKTKQLRISVKKLRKIKKGLSSAYYMVIAADKFGLTSSKLVEELFYKTHIVQTVLRFNKNKHFVVFK